MSQELRQRDYDVLIIGGGIMGLATGWGLTERSVGRVGVFEQATIGHRKGSSNGRVRIARTTYPNPDYVRLMQRARRDAWPRLEAQLGASLIRRLPGCFFGPEGGLVEAYADGVARGGANAERVTLSRAKALFNTLQLEGCSVIHDHTAGSIDAERTRNDISALLKSRGVDLIQGALVRGLDRSGARIIVSTDAGDFTAERLVVAAGAWSARLLPILLPRLMVHRQDVGYYQSSLNAAHPGGDFAWVFLGRTEDEIYYGLPEDPHTLKAAHHRRSGIIDDPDDPPQCRPRLLASLDAFISDHFQVRLNRADANTCPYTSTETDDFIVDVHPDDDRITIGAGFSGHGFKFAPIIGQILAELATTGRSTIDEFSAMRHQLSVSGPSS